MLIANLRLHRENVRLCLYSKEKVSITGPLVESLLDGLLVWEEAMIARFRILNGGEGCLKSGLYYLLSITALRMEIHRLSGLLYIFFDYYYFYIYLFTFVVPRICCWVNQRCFC
mgnify:FL=1